MVETIEKAAESRIDWRSTPFAPWASSSPRLRATTAVTPTLRDMITAKKISFGWLVIPTAAIASGPMVPTIMVSITPTSPTSTLSTAEGQAMLKVLP